jgi:ABC-type transport system involved in cytochrome c biogenesis permease component
MTNSLSKDSRSFASFAGFRPISAIASTTLTDLTRQRVFYFILILALVLIGSSVFMARFSFEEEFQILKDISLGTMSIFTSLLAILATARLIPQDIEDHTAYGILAKPVPRFEYVLGKLLGVVALLGLTVLCLSALFVAVFYAREQTVLALTSRQMQGAPAEQLAAAQESVRAAGLNLGVFLAIALILLKACILATLTLFVSTFATTNIFTVMVMVFVYFIGHLQPIAREYWLQEHGAGWLTKAFLALVALIFPDLQSFNLIDDVVAGRVIPLLLFGKTALLGGFYLIVYGLLGILSFSGKEL